MTEAATTKKTTKKRRGRPRKTAPAAPEPVAEAPEPQENAAASAATEAEIERRVEARFAEEKRQKAIDSLCAPDREFTASTWLHAPTCKPDVLNECEKHGCDAFSGLEVEERLRQGWWSDLV